MDNNNNNSIGNGSNWVTKRRIKRKTVTTASATRFKIDFSFKREVFFIIAGALVGAIIYVIPTTIFAVEQGSSYYLTWIVFGHIAGIFSWSGLIVL